MKERPILFSPPMVRAILAGTKTQTRRVVKVQPSIESAHDASWRDAKADLWRNAKQYARDCCPYGVAGDQLWVREKFYAVERADQGIGHPFLIYDEEWSGSMPDEGAPLRPCGFDFGAHPSIHMPRWASRITLELTDVRVERVNEISEANAAAEGIRYEDGSYELVWMTPAARGIRRIQDYENLWDKINGKKHPWSSNPWVWVLTFARIGAKVHDSAHSFSEQAVNQ